MFKKRDENLEKVEIGHANAGNLFQYYLLYKMFHFKLTSLKKNSIEIKFFAVLFIKMSNLQKIQKKAT